MNLLVASVLITISTPVNAQPDNIYGNCQSCNLPKPSEDYTTRQKILKGIIKEKKSMIMTLLRFVFSFFEMYIDDKKPRHNIPIKNSLPKNSASKTSKLRILNISFVSYLFKNNGAIITGDPLKKNKHSEMKNYFLKKNTVSSFPK